MTYFEKIKNCDEEYLAELITHLMIAMIMGMTHLSAQELKCETIEIKKEILTLLKSGVQKNET